MICQAGPGRHAHRTSDSSYTHVKPYIVPYIAEETEMSLQLDSNRLPEHTQNRVLVTASVLTSWVPVGRPVLHSDPESPYP